VPVLYRFCSLLCSDLYSSWFHMYNSHSYYYSVYIFFYSCCIKIYSLIG
jgi:hypothetical protein